MKQRSWGPFLEIPTFLVVKLVAKPWQQLTYAAPPFVSGRKHFSLDQNAGTLVNWIFILHIWYGFLPFYSPFPMLSNENLRYPHVHMGLGWTGPSKFPVLLWLKLLRTIPWAISLLWPIPFCKAPRHASAKVSDLPWHLKPTWGWCPHVLWRCLMRKCQTCGLRVAVGVPINFMDTSSLN